MALDNKISQITIKNNGVEEVRDIYAAEAEQTEKWVTPRNINGMIIDGTSDKTNYFICESGHSNLTDYIYTQETTKEGFELVEGAEITVQFIPIQYNEGDVKGQVYLRINGSIEVPLYYKGEFLHQKYIQENSIYTFRYTNNVLELICGINPELENSLSMLSLQTAMDKTDLENTINTTKTDLESKINNVDNKLNNCLLKYEDGKFYIGYDDTYIAIAKEGE